MHQEKYFYCLIDGGQIKSVGQLRTSRGETIEVAVCNFDASVYGYHFSDKRGWELIFSERQDWEKGVGVLSIHPDREANTYTEAEIAVELQLFRAIQRRSVQRGGTAELSPPTTRIPQDRRGLFDQPIKYDIEQTTIALEADGQAKPLDTHETVWEYGNVYGGVSRLVSFSRLTADWTSWEVSDRGETIVLLLKGCIEVHLDDGDQRRVVQLTEGGAFALIPRGIWYRLTVREAATVLNLIPAR